MKKITILLIAVFMAFGYSGWGQIFITELADPNNEAGARFVEIYNAGPTSVDLSTGWDLQRWTNANTTPQPAVELTGTIAAGGFYVACANQTTFTATYGFAADQNMGTGGPADSNGDDQIALRDPTDAIVDMFGVVGEDGSGTNHEFEDGRAERKATVTSGNTTYTFAEWNIWNDTGGAGTINDPQNAPEDFDPAEWIGTVSGPAISVSPATLTGFSYLVGNGPSDEQSFTVEGSDLTANITLTPPADYEISTGTGGSFVATDPITLTQSGGTVATTTIFTRLKADLIAADYNNEDITVASTGATPKTVTCSGSVEAPVTTTLPYNETFDSDLGDCYTYSVAGTNEWGWSSISKENSGHAYMNGWSGSNPEEDWLILPGINMDIYSDEIMQFYTYWGYGNDDADNYLKLMYSSDYTGIGDPSLAAWTEITYAVSSNSSAWFPCNVIDLSTITGTNVYFAFKYYSTGAPRSWRVDDISIVEGNAVNVTFQVDMSEADSISNAGVHVAGSFNGWSPSATELLDGDMDDVYAVTLPLYEGMEYQFKYINFNDWPGEEDVPEACEAPGETNRYEVIGSSDYSLDEVCFGSCVDCNVLTSYDITFRVNMQDQVVDGAGVFVAGTFTGWSNLPMTNTTGDVYEVTVSIEETTMTQYKFKNGVDGWEGNLDAPCGNGSNRIYTVPSENTILDLVCFNFCEDCPPPPVADFMLINEVDADTPGTDVAEFIELYDGGVGNTNLTGLVVVLYNGSDDQSYLPAIDLDGYSTDANGYFVIGSTGMGTDIEISPGSSGWLQNGPDAVALFNGDDTDFPNDTPVTTNLLIDAMVYDTDDSDDSGLLVLLNPGQPQVNENGQGDKDNHSNQRVPNGSGGQRNTITYYQVAPTIGTMNLPIITTWTGLTDANWDDVGNWDIGVPGPSFNVIIPAVTPFPVVGGPAACYDLTMQDASSLDVAVGGQLTIYGDLNMPFAKGPDVLANFTVKSDATGNGSVIVYGATGDYVTVERFIPAYTGPDDGWHQVATPVDFMPVSGSDFDPGANDDLYKWDETAYIWRNYKDTDPGEGWDGQVDLYATEGYLVAFENPGVREFYGLLASFIEWDFTDLSIGTGNGWHFLGNPFTSAMEWGTADWALSNIGGVAQIWDDASGNYALINAGGIIPSTNAFFVQASDPTNYLKMPYAARVHSTVNNYKTSPAEESEETLVLTMSNDENAYTDLTRIGFKADATEGWDFEIDAHKLFGASTAPQLWTVSADADYAQNYLPYVYDSYQLPLNFRAGVNTTYHLMADGIESFFPNSEIYLEDLFLDKITDLREEQMYSFMASTEDDNNRFVLHFYGVTSIGDETELNTTNIFAQQNIIYIKSAQLPKGAYQVEVFNVMGQQIYTGQLEPSTLSSFTLNEKTGVYVVRVHNENQTLVQKVIIK